jgi:hypothetical protein
MRRGLTNCFMRVSLGALIATALIFIASVSIASAQGPARPMLPFIPQENVEAPAPPADAPPGDAPAMDVPPPTSPMPSAAEQAAPPEVPMPPPSTSPKLSGSTVGWSRRTLSVTVSCGASGTVSVLRNGRRIGRTNFTCPPSGAVRVRVRITAAAARRLRIGTPLRVKVRAGGQRDTKRMRVVRAVRQPSDAAVGGKLAHVSANRECSGWYVTNVVAEVWHSSTSWYESFCSENGLYGTHIAFWWDYYYYTVAGYWSYYGTWTKYTQDGSWVYWDPGLGKHFGPY